MRHFLSNRKTKVEVNNVHSKQFYLREGLPQGSAISPILFLIFINDLDADLDLQTAASLFADDTSSWRHDGQIRGSDRVLMQKEIDKIMEWANTWKMKVNTSKTKSMVISSSQQDRHWNPEFVAAQEPIEAVQDYRFLGVTIPGDLKFAKHVDIIVTKCKNRNNIIKCMANKEWGNSLETQRKLYVQYIRMCLEYASPSWSPWISETQEKRLQVIQNDALRSVAGLAKTCPVDFLHLETGIEPIRDRFLKNDKLLWERYSRCEEEDPRRQTLDIDVPPRLKTRHGWRHKTRPKMQELEINREITAKLSPPWEESGMLFDSVKLEKKKEEYTTEELRERATRKVESMAADVIIYTDGSTDHNQENGGSGVYIEDNRSGETWTSSYAAGKLCSSFASECMALKKAL